MCAKRCETVEIWTVFIWQFITYCLLSLFYQSWYNVEVMFAKGFCGFLMFSLISHAETLQWKRPCPAQACTCPGHLTCSIWPIAIKNRWCSGGLIWLKNWWNWWPQSAEFGCVGEISNKRSCWCFLNTIFAKNMLRILQKVDEDSLSPYVYIIHIHANNTYT
jgi:hypothetical protein